MSDEELKTIDAMKCFGGRFVKALADAALRADGENFRRIKATWPELWARYSALSEALSKSEEP